MAEANEEAVDNGVPQRYTVLDNIVACGISGVIDRALNTSPAQRIASEMFNNSFSSCLSMSDSDIRGYLKTFNELPQAQGQVRMMPGAQRNIRAFVQFISHRARQDLPLDEVLYAPAMQVEMIDMRKEQERFVDQSEGLSKAAKPDVFKASSVWYDWSKLCVNYLRLIPGQNGIPLSYVIRTNDEPDRTAKPTFLDVYEATAPLRGAAFNADSAEAFILIKALVTGNTEAETTVNIHENTRDGRAAFADLRVKYEGIGIHAVARTSAEDDINKMFYIGEKPPSMTWDIFSSRLLAAYKKIDDIEQMPAGRHVYSDETKLMKLMRAVKADFLEPVKSSINVAIAANPTNKFTFENAMIAFRNKMLEKHPPNAFGQTMSRRQIRKTEKREENRRNKGGKGGYSPNGGGRRIRIRGRRMHRDNRLMTLSDGRVIDYHPSYHFDKKLELPYFTTDQRNALRTQRDSWRRNKGGRGGNVGNYGGRNGNANNYGIGHGGNGGGGNSQRSIHEIATAMTDAASMLSRQIQSSSRSVPETVQMEDGGSTIASSGSGYNGKPARRSIMGGRNEQARNA